MKNLTTRLMGAEIEYRASASDKSFESIAEYYSGMREVNTILLPCSDVLESLKVLKQILINMDDKIYHKLGTSGWFNSYGYAFNGMHLHLSGSINKDILRNNILKVIGKHGLSPRTTTSWHVMERPTNYNFKSRSKNCPVYRTSKGTTEIRILDLEYFIDDDIIEDLAHAIEESYRGKEIVGDLEWAVKLSGIGLENYVEIFKILDGNLSKFWEKLDEGVYKNTYANYTLDYTETHDYQLHLENLSRHVDEEVCEVISEPPREFCVERPRSSTFGELRVSTSWLDDTIRTMNATSENTGGDQ